MKISLKKQIKNTTTETVNSDSKLTETAYLLYSPANAEHLKNLLLSLKQVTYSKERPLENKHHEFQKLLTLSNPIPIFKTPNSAIKVLIHF